MTHSYVDSDPRNQGCMTAMVRSDSVGCSPHSNGVHLGEAARLCCEETTCARSTLSSEDSSLTIFSASFGERSVSTKCCQTLRPGDAEKGFSISESCFRTHMCVFRCVA